MKEKEKWEAEALAFTNKANICTHAGIYQLALPVFEELNKLRASSLAAVVGEKEKQLLSEIRKWMYQNFHNGWIERIDELLATANPSSTSSEEGDSANAATRPTREVPHEESGHARAPVIEEASIKAGCLDCKRPYPFGLDLVLPDQQWRHLVPGGNGLLCPNCISARAHQLKGATVILAWIDQFDWTAPRPAEWFGTREQSPDVNVPGAATPLGVPVTGASALQEKELPGPPDGINDSRWIDPTEDSPTGRDESTRCEQSQDSTTLNAWRDLSPDEQPQAGDRCFDPKLPHYGWEIATCPFPKSPRVLWQRRVPDTAVHASQEEEGEEALRAATLTPQANVTSEQTGNA